MKCLLERRVILFFARPEIRRAGDVSPLILREANNQGIDFPPLAFDVASTDSGMLRQLLPMCETVARNCVQRITHLSTYCFKTAKLQKDYESGRLRGRVVLYVRSRADSSLPRTFAGTIHLRALQLRR